MSWPRADPGNTIHQGEMKEEMGEVRGRERDERKKKRSKERCYSPTVRDHLTVASCTRVAHTSHGPLKITQGSALMCRAITYTTCHLGKILTLAYKAPRQYEIVTELIKTSYWRKVVNCRIYTSPNITTRKLILAYILY